MLKAILHFIFDERSDMSFMDNHIQKPWAVTQSEVLTETNTSESGLSEDAVRIRQKDGLNELAAKPPKTTLQMIKEQIIDPIIMILLGAAFFSALFHEYTEAIIIAMIVVINTIIGIVQEKKAQSSLAALRDMSAPMAHVIHAGKEQLIPAKELVVGDIVNLHDGDMVPADMRLLESANLKIQGASPSISGVTSAKKWSISLAVTAKTSLAPPCSSGMRFNISKIICSLFLTSSNLFNFLASYLLFLNYKQKSKNSHIVVTVLVYFLTIALENVCALDSIS